MAQGAFAPCVFFFWHLKKLPFWYLAGSLHPTWNYSVIATGNQYILIRCAEHHILKSPKYTKYSGLSKI